MSSDENFLNLYKDENEDEEEKIFEAPAPLHLHFLHFCYIIITLS